MKERNPKSNNFSIFFKNMIILFIMISLISGCLQQMNEIIFLDFSDELTCIYHSNKEFIITSQEEYEELNKYISPTCENFILPKINFDENILLIESNILDNEPNIHMVYPDYYHINKPLN